MKKWIAILIAALLLTSLFGCSYTTEDVAERDRREAEASGLTIHKIGVATYNVKDAQVMMFKNYLDSYIKDCFEDVTFLYSDSIGNEEEMISFLQTCADNGAEGILFFYTNDLKKEVEFCQSRGMYCIRPSGNVADEVFESVAGNPYFLGEIGPGAQTEYEEAVKMTRAMVNGDGTYIILSGGAAMGNEMHRQRTLAMLETLQKIAGSDFEQSAEALAVSDRPVEVQANGLKVMICPGYLELEQFQTSASEAIRSGNYSTVLSSIPVTPLMDALNESSVRCGVIDCFSEDNFFGFQKGKIGYVAGKYASEIGPAFAAMYNAVTGNAEAYRENGKAFRLRQGFWTAADMQEYDSMYALANGSAVNAYNYDDLHSVIRNLNPDTDFEAFKLLAESWSYEDCLARRIG